MNTPEIQKGGLTENQWREVEGAAKRWAGSRKDLDAALGILLREAVWSRLNAGDESKETLELMKLLIRVRTVELREDPRGREGEASVEELQQALREQFGCFPPVTTFAPSDAREGESGDFNKEPSE